MARVLSERRTKEEWELLVAMHRGYYPLVDNQPMNGGQGFRRTRPIQTEPGPDGQPPDNRHPMDEALEHLEKTFPLITSQWTAWSADDAVAQAELADGLSADRCRGRARSTARSRLPLIRALPTASPPRHVTPSRVPAKRFPRTGKGLVYTGFQWRGAAARCVAARIPGAR